MSAFNLLIVDDSIADTVILKTILKDNPIPVSLSVANNGEDGWTLIQKFSTKAQLILLDINMPDISGFDLLSTIRNHNHTKDIPVAMFSTGDREEDINTSYSLEANAYLTKPSDIASWRFLMRRVIQFWNYETA